MPEQFESPPLNPRIRSLISSVFVALASGTPYVYAMYAPQLVKNSHLTLGDSGKLSLALSIGSSIGGLPAGIFIDWAGPATSTVVGSLFTFISFATLHNCYINQSQDVTIMMAALAASGFGSVLCFYSTVNCITANFPHHRGTAGAFPVASYALAALVYSAVAVNCFKDNTGGLLKFFSLFSPIVCLLGSYFLVIVDKNRKKKKTTSEFEPLLRRNSSFLEQANELRKHYQQKLSLWGVGRTPSQSALASPNSSFTDLQGMGFRQRLESDAIYVAVEDVPIFVKYGSPIWNHHILQKITSRIYIKFYIILASLQSIGQLYIYSVGYLVSILEDGNKKSPLTSAEIQALQVSTLAFASFTGRLCSGPISDIIVKKLKAQRLWCILVAGLILSLGQFLTRSISNLDHLIIPSFINGFSFGFTFGAFPACIADSFGTEGFSTLWGFLTTGAVFLLTGLTSNLASTMSKNNGEDGSCHLGSGCYSETFKLTQYGSLFICLLVAFTIFWNHKISKK